VPTVRRSRTIAAPVEELWLLIGDPHHLPRWWPRVDHVEDVEENAFTEVMRTSRGKLVRADYELVESDERSHVLRWQQRLAGTPFARLFSSAETRVWLEQAGEGTSVTIELRQTLTGFFPRFGAFLLRRAARATLEEALNGLERISG